MQQSKQFTDFITGICQKAHQQNTSFARSFSLGDDLDISASASGKIVLVNRDNHKGIRGRVVFLGAVRETVNSSAEDAEENPQFMWTWGWKLTDIHLPAIKPIQLTKWLSSKLPQLSIGVEEGSAILKTDSQAILIRAICMRALNLQFICEITGPTGDCFVLGVTNARAHTMSVEQHEKLAEIVDIVEDKNATPTDMEKYGICVQKLDVGN